MASPLAPLALSLAFLHIGFLPSCFCQQSNFTSAYNFIYISPKSLSNKGHSSRQRQGHVLERDLVFTLCVCVFMHTCAWYVCVVNSNKSAHFDSTLRDADSLLQDDIAHVENVKALLVHAAACPMSLNLGSRSTPPRSPIRIFTISRLNLPPVSHLPGHTLELMSSPARGN